MKKIKILSFLISYLNIFYASEAEQDTRKTIIRELKALFINQKYYSKYKDWFQVTTSNKKPLNFFRFFNRLNIFYDFTKKNKNLYSEKFSEWLYSFYLPKYSEDPDNFNKNMKKIDKAFNLKDVNASLVMILNPDKGITDKEKEYINQLRNVFIELMNYYSYDRLPAEKQHGEEIKELFKAFTTQQPFVFSGKQFTFITCLILSSAIYNYFKNNNNKKIIIPLMIIELYFIVMFYISQETQKEQRSEKTTNHHSEKKAITINPS